MKEQECLNKMVAPGQHRPGKYRGGVIQIHITRSCDKSCFACTQGSQLRGVPSFITLEQFESALKSLGGYWGVVGLFGGNPALHPQFEQLCNIFRIYIPYEQRGLWCNNPINESKATAMRQTFNPAVSNLNVHLDEKAFGLFRKHWPESRPFGLHQDSRHSPCYVAMKDVLKTNCPKCMGEGRGRWDHDTGCRLPVIKCDNCAGTGLVYDESRAWELISRCDINQHWSAMIGVFRNELRAWFCEIAGAQAMLHQHDPDYPDTGLNVEGMYEVYTAPDNNSPHDTIETTICKWWQLTMHAFRDQVRKHCHECSVPLRGYGELSQGMIPSSEDNILPREQVSATHQSIFNPKDKHRRVELVVTESQLGKPLVLMTDYLGNAKR